MTVVRRNMLTSGAEYTYFGAINGKRKDEVMESAALKAKLKVVLHAGKETVAESEDPGLWQQVLAAITRGESGLDPATDGKTDGSPGEMNPPVEAPAVETGEAVNLFARQLQVGLNDLIGACDPTEEKPYLCIDRTSWANWRNRVSEKGPGAVSAVGMVATILALWFVQLKKGDISFSHVNAVLSAIGVENKNPTRTINNCLWLQLKNKDQIRLHPSHMARAIGVVKIFIGGGDS